MRLFFAATLFLMACSGRPPPTRTPDPFDAGPSFTSGTVTGTGLWLTTDFTRPEAPRLQVWGQQFGATFGYAFHVAVRGSNAALSDAVVEPALGADATTVVGGNQGDRLFGSVRRGPSAGTKVIETPTLLATLTIASLRAGEAEVVIERAQVRRSDGSLVPVKVVGGTLSFPGANQ
jgi:hypothetical protein